MTGSLQHLGGNRWRWRWDEPDPTGRRRQRSISFTATSRRAAERTARSISQHIDIVNAQRASHVGTFAELVEDWLTVKASHCSPTTMAGYRRHTAPMLTAWCDRQAADLTGRDIDIWFATLTDINAGTRRHMWATLRAVLRFGHQKRDLPHIATDRATAPRHTRPELEPPDPGLVRELLAECASSDWGRAIRLAALTGARRGEIVGARIGDVRWVEQDGAVFGTWVVARAAIEVGGEVVSKLPKSGRSRRIELSQDAAAVVLAQAAWVGGRSVWLFPQPGGWDRSRSPSWLSHAWDHVRRSVPGARHVRLHDLRHRFASSALDAGVPITTVSELLGHAQTSTTVNIYGHGSAQGRRAAVESVAGMLSPEASS